MTMQTTEVSLKNHYAGIRARLFNTKPKEPVQIKTVQVAKVVPFVTKRLPAWQAEDIQFDAHVRLYRELIREFFADQAISHISDAMRDRDTATQIRVPYREPVRKIVNSVLVNFPELTWSDLKSRRRQRRLVLARHIAMYEVSRQRKDMSLPMIGRAFGGFDHTSVLHAIRRIRAMIEAGEL